MNCLSDFEDFFYITSKDQKKSNQYINFSLKFSDISVFKIFKGKTNNLNIILECALGGGGITSRYSGYPYLKQTPCFYFIMSVLLLLLHIGLYTREIPKKSKKMWSPAGERL